MIIKTVFAGSGGQGVLVGPPQFDGRGGGERAVAVQLDLDGRPVGIHPQLNVER